MKRFSDVRKIKIFSDVLKKGETYIAKNTLEVINIDDITDHYQTQFFINNNNLKIITGNKKQLIKSNRSYSKLMEIPDLSLPLSDILNIYNVDTFEELFELIKNLLFNNESEYTIFRLVDTYTRIFYDDLKKTNKSLIKIFKLIFNNDAINHIDISLYIIDDTKLSSFIKKWLEKKDKDDFYFNISNDVKNFLSNKYESI
jgi:hypothetical protein